MAYNIRISSFNCKSAKRSIEHIRQLCQLSDIVALQETWLMPHNLGFLSEIDENFLHHGISGVNASEGILRGRPFQQTKYIIDTNDESSRVVAIKFKINNLLFIAMSVFVNEVSDDFGCFATSSVDDSKVVRGRPYGSLAILWRKSVFSNVTVIPCANERLAA
ncbi:unnamed protein product, partial [Leptidea sinapis]